MSNAPDLVALVVHTDLSRRHRDDAGHEEFEVLREGDTATTSPRQDQQGAVYLVPPEEVQPTLAEEHPSATPTISTDEFETDPELHAARCPRTGDGAWLVETDGERECLYCGATTEVTE